MGKETVRATPSKTELSIERQPGILGLEWRERVPANAQAAVRGAKSVTFVGTGTSHHCALWASWFAHRASRGKLDARAVTTWDLLASNLPKHSPRTELWVVISHRGAADLTKRALAMIGKRRCVLVCAESAPRGGRPCVRSSPLEASGAHTMALVGAMAACSELIAAALPAREAKKIRTDRERLAAVLQELAFDSDDLKAALGGIITRGAGLHFVGGGAFHAIALELALKAREMIHVPAHGYNTEEFLHGPVSSVNEDDTLVALEALKGGDGSPLERLLFTDRLTAARKAAEAVGALVLEPSWDSKTSRVATLLEPEWQAVLALYWGQMLCLSTAQSWQVNPDVNRRDDPRYEDAFQRSKIK